jgi:alanyl-tRNA synthetase
MEGFEKMMTAQRERARAASKFVMADAGQDNWVVLNEGNDSEFVGYETLAVQTRIMRYRITGKDIQVILEKTPFYAESGGQVGDKGTIEGNGYVLTVTDTQKDGDHIIHFCQLLPDFRPASDQVKAVVQSSARRNTQKNHTATHLLHAALRQVLGTHVTQAGSLVEPERLRFDFTHYERVTPEQLEKIERIVNRKIQENIPLEITQKKFDEAKKEGAMALFGEKYGDIVRTIKIGDFSFELCGGTHVKATGEIGVFIILSESGIASGVRRIEAITGEAAVDFILQNKKTLQQLSALLNAQEHELADKTEQLLNEKRQLEKELEKLKAGALQSGVDEWLQQAETINGVRVVVREMKDVDGNQLKALGDRIREKGKNVAALLIAKNKDKLNLVCVVGDDLIKEKKLHAGNIVREVARQVGGGGGGRPHLATAGGKDVDKKDKAIAKFKELIAE